MARLIILLFSAVFIAANAQAEQQPTRPNILFIIADDISRTSMSAYGCKYIKTPHFDRIASEGVLFSNAYVTNPKCAPTRACLLTGRYSWQLEEAANHQPVMPPKWRFYPDILEKAGYKIGFTGKGWAPGVYYGEHNPAGWEYNDIKLKPPYKRMSNKDYAGNFEAFLNSNKDNKPFCFWLGTHEAHRGYEKDSHKKANIDSAKVEVQAFFPDHEVIRGDLADYAVEVEYYDEVIGKARTILESRGLLEDTLIVVTSDHGMPFPRIKGQIYDEGFHVAFAAMWKGKIKPGRVVTDFINFPDVAPTFLEAAGLEKDPQMTGESFLDILLSDKSGRIDPNRNFAVLGKERHDVGRMEGDQHTVGYPARAIRTDDYLFVRNYKPNRWPAGDPEYGYRNVDGSPTKYYLTNLSDKDKDYQYFLKAFGKRPEVELYDMKKDIHCVNNLASKPEFKSVMESLESKMKQVLTAQQDPRMLGNGDIFDYYPHRDAPRLQKLYEEKYYNMWDRFAEKYGRDSVPLPE
ncbi:heparan N-sulfatase [bacterium E08(2017)]|nr:heparan N-sulfatase [bacterium E08(2017)]